MGKKELKKREYLEMEKKKKENGEEENVDAKKDEIMDELVKEIEELENEVSGNSEVDTDKEKEADGGGIDWGSSALSEIITDKEKEERKKKKEEKRQKKKEEKERKKAEEEKKKKIEDGEISDGIEDGEVSSGDERKRTKYTRASKRSR